MPEFRQLVHAKAIAIGKLALRATTAAGTGHPTSALSLAHIVTLLMYRHMRWSPRDPGHPGSDRLVLSEGHAVPIIYAACADLGVTFGPKGATRAMTVRDLDTLRDIASLLDGHPNPALGFPFFDAATGSLGQGLSVAAGLAAAARVDAIGKRIFCLIGDGEAREGQIWEAMDFIRDQELDGVVAIFNCNQLGQSDFVSPQEDWDHLRRKAEAFGFEARVVDGHDPDALEAALSVFPVRKAPPLAIIARTVKGWGVPHLQGPGHHGTAVKPDKLEAAIAALDATARELGAAEVQPADLAAAFTIAPALDVPDARRRHGPANIAVPTDTLTRLLAGKTALSPRRSYGVALEALGAAEPRIVALDGDVKNSTYAEGFAKAHPDRYFEGRIAEQNMISVAAGLAAAGKIPFASTFGRFLERAFDQVEMAVIGGLPLKLVGSHVGVTLAADGPSQMALADLGFMRTFAHVSDHSGRPAMRILTPADAVAAFALTLSAAADPGSCYLRLVRGDLPILYAPDEQFPFDGFKIAGGTRDTADLILVGSGYTVHACRAAAERLAEGGTRTMVIDAYALPLDTATILGLARSRRAPVLTVEDNYVGGVGSELAEAAAGAPGSVPVRSLVVRTIPKSGRTAEDVLAYVHLSVPDIVAAARDLTAGRRAAE